MLNTAEVPKTTPPTTGQFYDRKYTSADLPVVLTARRVTITDFTISRVLDVNSNLVTRSQSVYYPVRATFNIDATVQLFSYFLFLFMSSCIINFCS